MLLHVFSSVDSPKDMESVSQTSKHPLFGIPHIALLRNTYCYVHTTMQVLLHVFSFMATWHASHCNRIPFCHVYTPMQVLLHVFSFMDSPKDMQSVSQTCRGILNLSKDPHMSAQWLMKNRHGSSMVLAGRQKGGSHAVMVRLLRLDAPATVVSLCFFIFCTCSLFEEGLGTCTLLLFVQRSARPGSCPYRGLGACTLLLFVQRSTRPGSCPYRGLGACTLLLFVQCSFRPAFCPSRDSGACTLLLFVQRSFRSASVPTGAWAHSQPAVRVLVLLTL